MGSCISDCLQGLSHSREEVALKQTEKSVKKHLTKADAFRSTELADIRVLEDEVARRVKTCKEITALARGTPHQGHSQFAAYEKARNEGMQFMRRLKEARARLSKVDSSAENAHRFVATAKASLVVKSISNVIRKNADNMLDSNALPIGDMAHEAEDAVQQLVDETGLMEPSMNDTLNDTDEFDAMILSEALPTAAPSKGVFVIDDTALDPILDSGPDFDHDEAAVPHIGLPSLRKPTDSQRQDASILV